MPDFFPAILGTMAKHPELGIGWIFVVYLLWRLHQLTDRQHESSVETAKVLTAIKTFLITRFGGSVE